MLTNNDGYVNRKQGFTNQINLKTLKSKYFFKKSKTCLLRLP